MKTPAELREIAHRATHYYESHGDLAVLTFAPYSCDTIKQNVSVSYKDIALVFGKLADLLDQPEPTEAQKAAKDIQEKLGSWTLGQVGRGGIKDALWGVYPPFQNMSKEDRESFADAVYEEIFG